MSMTVDSCIAPLEFTGRPQGDFSIGAAVRSMLGSQIGRQQCERRREQRFPFPYPIRLTPVAPDGCICAADSVVVLGKSLSEHGADFYYGEPLPYRRVIATFERAGREVLHLLMDLTWCRFGRHGWYENGGRFLEVVNRASPRAASLHGPSERPGRAPAADSPAGS